jgi:hypothetical protein
MQTYSLAYIQKYNAFIYSILGISAFFIVLFLSLIPFIVFTIAKSKLETRRKFRLAVLLASTISLQVLIGVVTVVKEIVLLTIELNHATLIAYHVLTGIVWILIFGQTFSLFYQLMFIVDHLRKVCSRALPAKSLPAIKMTTRCVVLVFTFVEIPIVVATIGLRFGFKGWEKNQNAYDIITIVCYPVFASIVIFIGIAFVLMVVIGWKLNNKIHRAEPMKITRVIFVIAGILVLFSIVELTLTILGTVDSFWVYSYSIIAFYNGLVNVAFVIAMLIIQYPLAKSMQLLVHDAIKTSFMTLPKFVKAPVTQSTVQSGSETQAVENNKSTTAESELPTPSVPPLSQTPITKKKSLVQSFTNIISTIPSPRSNPEYSVLGDPSQDINGFDPAKPFKTPRGVRRYMPMSWSIDEVEVNEV